MPSPLLVIGLKRSDISRFPMLLQPTLVLDEPELRPEMQMLLQASTERGAQIISSHDLLEFYGPKVICSGKLPLGTALETESLRAALIPTAGHLPPLDRKMEGEIAEEFQAAVPGLSSAECPQFAKSQFYRH